MVSPKEKFKKKKKSILAGRTACAKTELITSEPWRAVLGRCSRW